MGNKNIFENLFLEAEKTNLQVLMDNALNEKDPDKKKVLMGIYTYAIGKKQKELLQNKEFVIWKERQFMLSIIADLISLITDTLSNYLWYSDERKNNNNYIHYLGRWCQDYGQVFSAPRVAGLRKFFKPRISA